LFGRTTSLTAALAACLLLLNALPFSARQAQGEIAFRDVDVFDGSRMIRRTNVLVRGGMVRAVGRDVVIPPSAQVVEGAGKTLLPGLFDAHMHLGMRFGEEFLRDALDFGVTTEFEMGGGEAGRVLRRRMDAGDLQDVADFRTAATVVTAPGGHPSQMGGPPFPTFAPGDDAQAFVDARIAEGADYIKVVYEHKYPTLTKQQLGEVVAAAHRRNKLAVVHVSTQSEARDAVAAGADGLVHVFGDSMPAPGFAEFVARHRVFVIPTLSVIETATGTSDKPWWKNEPRVAPYITPSLRRMLDRKFPPGFRPDLKFKHALAAVRALHRAGVPLLAGTDAPAPGLAHGLSLHRELELLVRSGFTPLEALASATSRPAHAFGFRDRGRIATGLRADLLLVKGDPTRDITATRDIVGIWKLGVPHLRRSAEDKGSRQ
jgi:imidazolonepropionase-like amidohydrolase